MVTTAATASSRNVSLTAFSGETLADGLVRWRAIEERVGSQGWACRADFIEAFVTAYGDFNRPECVVVQRDGVEIGAALLCQKTLNVLGRLGFEALLNGTGGEPYGDPFICDGMRLLAAPDNYADVERAVTEHALKRSHVDAVYWSGYREDAVTSLMKRDPRVEVTRHRTHAIDLSKWSDDAATSEARWVTDVDEAADVLTQMIAWRDDWGTVGENGYEGRFERFLHDLTRRLVPNSRAAIVSTGEAAVWLMLDESDQSVLTYSCGGVNDTAQHRAHAAAASLAKAHGYTRLDFELHHDLADDLADHTRPLLFVRIPHPTWRSRLVFGLSRVKQRLRR